MSVLKVIQEFIKKDSVKLVIIGLVLLSIGLLAKYYYNTQTQNIEGMEDVDPAIPQMETIDELEQADKKMESTSPFVSDNAVNGHLNPADLLPISTDAQAFDTQFPQPMGELANINLLSASHHIGINTVGSSLKNPNVSLRSDPPIPRQDVGPWNQSTILASDLTNRRGLEIGSGC